MMPGRQFFAWEFPMTTDQPAHAGAAFSATIETLDLTGATTHRAVESAVDPLAAAVFDATADGEEVDIDAIIDTLIEAFGLDADQAHWARITLERNAEAGEAKRRTTSRLLVLSRPAILVAAGALQWEFWRADHPDELAPAANGFAVRAVAKRLALRCRDILGISLNPEEAAWATIEGAHKASLPVDRGAWSAALEGAESGERERLANIATRMAA